MTMGRAGEESGDDGRYATAKAKATATATSANKMSPSRRREAAASVKRMFYHGYDSYMKYAFPHDELKPISKSYTDSLGELVGFRHPDQCT